MGNNTFLYKEINFTKNGKKVFQNTKNCYSQMITSLKHSLRVLEEEKIHLHLYILFHPDGEKYIFNIHGNLLAVETYSEESESFLRLYNYTF